MKVTPKLMPLRMSWVTKEEIYTKVKIVCVVAVRMWMKKGLLRKTHSAGRSN